MEKRNLTLKIFGIISQNTFSTHRGAPLGLCSFTIGLKSTQAWLSQQKEWPSQQHEWPLGGARADCRLMFVTSNPWTVGEYWVMNMSEFIRKWTIQEIMKILEDADTGVTGKR